MNILQIITVMLSLTVTCLGLTSQAYKNHKRRSMEGLSFFYFLMLAISYSFLALHGWIEKDKVLIVTMSAGTLVSWFVVAQFALYKKGCVIARQ